MAGRKIAGTRRREPLPSEQTSIDPLGLHERERVTEKAANKLQLSLVVVAAVSALAGAAIGGVTAYATTTRQIEAQTQQLQDEFLRGQRQTAYADFFESALTVVVDPPSQDDFNDKLVPQLESQAATTCKALRKAQARVDLYGSDAAVKAASDAIKKCEAYDSYLNGLLSAFVERTARLYAYKALAKQSDFLDAVNHFQDVARQDFASYRSSDAPTP